MEELSWAVRRYLEHAAAERPVALVVEDVHWAEPSLLELIEQLVRAIDDAPVLVLCPARPALVDESPDWGTGERATRIELEPLDAEASRAMVESLLGGGALDPDVLDRVVTAAEGNPLFAGQLLQMLVDEGVLQRENGSWRATGPLSDLHVPPTIQALLAARLDTLAGDERAVVEPASVVGYVFADAAVSALAPPEVSPRVATELTSLAQKHFVQRVEEGDEAHHRFQHIMIRDTAYDGILKRARADLHERFVVWADEVNRDRGAEFEEILGYHLEQAWKYLSELGPLDDRGRAIGVDGARRLASAGRRAFARGDVPAAANLLGRAAALLPEDHPERMRLLPEHGEALLLTGQLRRGGRGARRGDRASDDAPAAAARARLVRLLVRLRTGDEGWDPRHGRARRSPTTIEVFDAAGDEAGLAMAWRLLAWVAGIACRFGDAAEASSAPSSTHGAPPTSGRSDVRLRRTRPPLPSGQLSWTRRSTAARAAIEQTAGDRQSEGISCSVLAVSTRCRVSSTTPARSRRGAGRSSRSSVSRWRRPVSGWRRRASSGSPVISMLPSGSSRAAYEALDAVGEKYVLSTVAGFLAQTLLEQGALEEAAQHASGAAS